MLQRVTRNFVAACNLRIARSSNALAAQVAHRPFASEAAQAGFGGGSPHGTEAVITGEDHLTSIMFSINDSVGALRNVLEVFEKHGVSMTHIQSKPNAKNDKIVEFTVSFGGSGQPKEKVDGLMAELSSQSTSVITQEPMTVPWFPRHISDIDNFSTKTLDAGAELESDHPGFNDVQYRERRASIVENALSYRYGTEIPRVQYNDDETRTWGEVYKRLTSFTSKFAVPQYNEILPRMEANCGYAEDNIPQLQDISEYLDSCTGFTLRPVGGLLSARDFLNALAFRVFFSTQYIRHHSTPLYTPEPDICHELMGHAPMFADPDFADFSHEIGLASLGASDEDIKRLATCYWFSVEFGLAKGPPGEGYKAYGAGLLSSFGELEYSCAPYRPGGDRDVFPDYKPWVPANAATQEYPITDYQPVYFVAEDLHDAKVQMRKYCTELKRPFYPKYNFADKSVTVDRAIKRGAYTVTLQTG